MDDSIAGFLFGGCIFLSAFFSCSETAFFSLSPLKLKRQEVDGDTRAGEILKVISDKQRLMLSLSMGSTMVNVSAVVLAVHFFYGRNIDHGASH